MIEIKNISVKIKEEDKLVIHDLSLTIKDGEVHAIMGPNGTGKSTLSKAIMGHYKYEVVAGDILMDGESIKKLEVNERAKKGIFLGMQDPTVIDGVTNSELLKNAKQEITGEHINYFDFIKTVDNALKNLEFEEGMVHRHVNKGFSGGEKKKK